MAHSLTSLAVFQNITHKELVRSLHVYESEEKEIEREFLFDEESCYLEKKETKPLFGLEEGDLKRPEEICKGLVIGKWRCIFMFRFNEIIPRFPPRLCLSSNTKLEGVPNLAKDLKFISELKKKKVSKVSDKEKCGKIQHCNQPKTLNLVAKVEGAQDCEINEPKTLNLVAKVDIAQDCEVNQPKCAIKLDLNSLPDSDAESMKTENVQTEHSESDAKSTDTMKTARAQSEHISKISLEDISKYFGVPIVEASKRLNVGLTVLKKKCRQFGIPRWPHRKIKSLDTLIHDLQGEAERQKEKNEAAAMAAAKKSKKLETEKRNLVKRPFLEINLETKKFRQDNFKKRHKASRAKKIQESLVTSPSTFNFLELLAEASSTLG